MDESMVWDNLMLTGADGVAPLRCVIGLLLAEELKTKKRGTEKRELKKAKSEKGKSE